MILLTLIAWEVGVFTAIAGLPFFPLVEKIVVNTYFSGVACSIISVVIIYKWQVWYSKRKLKQDFRCNECIEDIYDGIEAVCKYSPLIPEKEKGNEGSDFTELRLENAQRYVDFYLEHKGDIYLGNLALSYEENDLLIDSIQSCFFINLNFKLLEILNNVKNRLLNLRNKYPEIEDLEKKYKETHSEELMIQLGEKLATYFVDAKFMAGYSGDVDALGVLRVLEAVRVCGLTKTCKVYQASTSELYGKVEEVPQRETTPFHPYSPYAVAKQYGFWMVKEYRDAYGMFAVNGILFNHESERRGENFVTRKITLAAGRIAEGLQDHLELGNMDSLRDWGYAKDYVECMWLIMQQEKPDDFVIATGVQHTVRDFTEKAFAANGITLRWEGTGIDEKGYDAATGKMLVCVNPQWFRPTDVDNLWGDPTKAKTVLGWNPQSTTYEQLVEIMAKHDRERAKREKALKAVL